MSESITDDELLRREMWRIAGERWLTMQEKVKAEGRLHVVWEAFPTAPRYTNMRIAVERSLTDAMLGTCSVGIARLTITDAKALRDEIDAAIATYEQHIKDGTGEE